MRKIILITRFLKRVPSLTFQTSCEYSGPLWKSVLQQSVGMGSSSGQSSSSDKKVKVKVRPLVFCGPSGSGKSSLLKKLLAEYPSIFGFSVSHTTRSPRPGEVDGREYHFTSLPAMKQLVTAGSFLEHATFSGNMYGTSKQAVHRVSEVGKMCILDIDVQGVKQLKEREDIQGELAPLYIFIKPPSIEALKRRLEDRGTETEESLNKRLSAAASEMEYGAGESGQVPHFNKVVVNDDLETAYGDLKKFLTPHIESVLQ